MAHQSNCNGGQVGTAPGIYELLFGKRDEVPPKAAINEAIELAKSFGGDASYLLMAY